MQDSRADHRDPAETVDTGAVSDTVRALALPGETTSATIPALEPFDATGKIDTKTTQKEEVNAAASAPEESSKMRKLVAGFGGGVCALMLIAIGVYVFKPSTILIKQP